VLLRSRAHFDDDEIAEIMGLSAGEVSQRFGAGLRRIATDVSGITDYNASIFRLPAHPLPVRSTQATMNLSEVMQGIKTKPVGLNSPLRIALLVLAVGLGATLYFSPGVLKRLVHVARDAENGG
jgi:hypothetical protein